jgi:hypothetical protein
MDTVLAVLVSSAGITFSDAAGTAVFTTDLRYPCNPPSILLCNCAEFTLLLNEFCD